MTKIKLLIQSKNDPAVIYIRLRDGRKTDIKAKTNFFINSGDWDAKEEAPSKRLLKDPNFMNLDTDLKGLKISILKAYNASKGEVLIDSEWLKNFINPAKEEEKYTDKLADYIGVYIDFKKNEVKSTSVGKWKVIQELVKSYEAHTKTTLYIRNIDNKFKMDFEKYCLNKYKPNTTARTIRFIKTFCRHAKSNGVETHHQLDSIKVKYLKVDNIYLNNEELTKIENIKKNKLTDSLQNARDWLIISCYCGQRVSDFLRFDKSMIRYEKNKEGVLKPLIEFTQVKTDKIMTIPLHSKIMAILKKNGGNFPRKISDQKYNKYIKDVCEAAEINELMNGVLFNKKTKVKEEKLYEKWRFVASHIGRRSFATNFYGVIPTSYLTYVTGHSTETMFLTYIGKSNKDKAMELTNYF